jgi:hypothetical protein
MRGEVVFDADQGGSARYLTGRSYDLYGAAADVLEAWAANVALQFDFAEDDQSYKVSQKQRQLLRLAGHYRQRSTNGGVMQVPMYRSDVNGGDYLSRSERNARGSRRDIY